MSVSKYLKTVLMTNSSSESLRREFFVKLAISILSAKVQGFIFMQLLNKPSDEMSHYDDFFDPVHHVSRLS